MIENIILDYYEHRKKQSNIKLGLNRFPKGVKITVIISIIVLFLSLLSIFFLMLFFPKQYWFLIGVGFCAAALIVLYIFDTANRKKNAEERIKAYKEKIDLLNDILGKEFSIDTKEKLCELISKYQKYIDDVNKADKKKNSIFITITTSILTVISTIIKEIDLKTIDHEFWLSIAFIIIFAFCIACTLVYGSIYFNKYFNSTKQRYESIINDLEYLKLSKY